jgi:hypothetical protein
MFVETYNESRDGKNKGLLQVGKERLNERWQYFLCMPTYEEYSEIQENIKGREYAHGFIFLMTITRKKNGLLKLLFLLILENFLGYG